MPLKVKPQHQEPWFLSMSSVYISTLTGALEQRTCSSNSRSTYNDAGLISCHSFIISVSRLPLASSAVTLHKSPAKMPRSSRCTALRVMRQKLQCIAKGSTPLHFFVTTNIYENFKWQTKQKVRQYFEVEWKCILCKLKSNKMWCTFLFSTSWGMSAPALHN